MGAGASDMILSREIDDATREVIAILDAMSIPYALGGAIAMGLLGHIRATRDVDILIVLPALRSQEFCDALNAAGFRGHDAENRPIPVEVPAMARSWRDLGMCRVWWKEVKVELFVPKVPLQDSILQRRFRASLSGRQTWIMTAEDLVLMKAVFHRDKDLVDLKRLLVANRTSLDVAYVESWIPRTLPTVVGDELREMMRAAGVGA